MNKICEAMHSATGNRFATYKRGVSLYAMQDQSRLPDLYGLEYMLELRLRAVVKVEEDKLLLPMMRHARRAILENILGEFRPQLNKIRDAALDYDMKGVLDEVGRLEAQMFDCD